MEAHQLTVVGDTQATSMQLEQGETVTNISNDSQTNNADALLTASAIHTLTENSGKYYAHDQTSATTVWTVNHNFGVKYVNVEVIVGDKSVAGTYDEPEIEFVSVNQLTCTFSVNTAGVCVVLGG